MKTTTKLSCLILCLLHLSLESKGEQCGRQSNGAFCPNGLCCSQFGWCGDTDPYCGTEMMDAVLVMDFIAMIVSIAAARSFNGFGTTGDDNTRKKELAAFLGQTSHETTGGWSSAPDGPYAWGYCFVNQVDSQGDFCASRDWPCSPGKSYHGRGPIQLTYNYNYGQAGNAINQDLIRNPDLVSTNPIVSFKTAIWFWMTPQGNKPSSHDVITGRWTPSSADWSAGRVPGYGVLSNLGVSPGRNLDCNNQRSFA
ncbi:unnamed protein product [Vicia faba]|uniref:chitinase n=1 Tax=Vicia faba TaxID=3906 RepID=A0AAV1AFA3_VICFA|nr:unnamed protein product [Vicia faba]